jgi:hypothetical protein
MYHGSSNIGGAVTHVQEVAEFRVLVLLVDGDTEGGHEPLADGRVGAEATQQQVHHLTRDTKG